ncbi:MAG: toll/interleukin-1 receptor domain-containing protein [Actinomycetota bacterium]|nr:toll/interleukin-1 receptor domain-containing protein [Actinomycetota bacterium]
MPQGDELNIYSPVDVPAERLPTAPRVFISHRDFDKPLAEAVTAVLAQVGVHYWFDREDADSQAAAALGMVGDQLLVHAIERGARHCTHLLGLLSSATAGSWWVPYEIGFSRSADIPVSYLVLKSIRAAGQLPEYVRLGANFWSVDELVRWATSLSGDRAGTPDPSTVVRLADFVPRQPPAPTVHDLAERAVAAIDRLAEPGTWTALALHRTDTFSWLPTTGGIVRDLAYDLLAPLAYADMNADTLTAADRTLLRLAFRAPTLHHELAESEPALPYAPQVDHWRRRRYENPPVHWLQGLSADQLSERIRRFLIVDDLDGRRRLATREEFKATFDRILRSGTEHDKRAVGVLVNPLFGFTPADRPVYWRVLALQYHAYSEILGRTTPFDSVTTAVTRRFAQPPTWR